MKLQTKSPDIDRRTLLAAGAAAIATASTAPAWAKSARVRARKPNVVLILCDDLGYGDVGAYGGRMIKTPAMDRMAREGAMMTAFYASANVCTPSRAGLLTGRYPIRTGLAQDVIRAADTNGLPLSETTIAKALKPDYATALVGKWHLGHVAPHWPPTVHGFDVFFGVPYSHDMKPLALFTAEPGKELQQEPVDMSQLTARFFARGVRFIEDNKDKPFFLMLALTAPHEPENPHPDFAGKSKAAAYGDVVEEIDANLGKLLARLKTLGLEKDTLVILTSDNGPWFEGSSGPLRERKGAAGWDGGYRVPFIARQPGTIPPGLRTGAIAMNIDLLPTILAWTGKSPTGAELDGRDITRLLKSSAAPSPHDELVLFHNERVAAIRTQRWKLVSRTYYRGIELPLDSYGYAALVDVEADPSESYNMAALHPEVMKDMTARLERAKKIFEPMGLKQTPDKLPAR